MPTSLIQRSWAGGEISPSLYARGDLSKYQTALATCKNFIVQKHGGVANRPGTRYIGTVKTPANRTVLLRFVFNEDQTYVIEVGDRYMRFWKNGAQIVVSGVAAWSNASAAITGATQANPCVITAVAHPFTNGMHVTIAGVGGMVQLNGNTYTVQNAAANTFELAGIDSTAYGAYTVGGTATRAYVVGDLVVSGGINYYAVATSSNNIPPNVAFWYALTGAIYEIPTPYIGTDLVFSAPGFSGVLQNNVNGLQVSQQGDVLTITHVDYKYSPGELTRYADTKWILTGGQVPGGFVGGGGFAASTYYQQRRWYGGLGSNIEYVIASQVGNYSNFSPGVNDADPFNFTVVGRTVNAIRHMLDLGVLVIFSAESIYVVKGDVSGIVTPTQINLRAQHYHGASRTTPAAIGSTAIYVQGRGSIVRDLTFNNDAQGYQGSDLTVFAGHLFTSYQIMRLAFAAVPNSLVWAVRNDGVLLGLTYLPEQEIWGWHRHTTGIADTFEDVCVVPEGDEDAVYVLVRRTINGAVTRYLERFESRVVTDITKDAKFTDAHLSYDGWEASAATVILSTGAGWTVTDTITVTASANRFTAGNVGDTVLCRVTATDGTVTNVRVAIETYISPTVISGRPSKTVPAAFQGVPLSTWALAVRAVSGLSHLEGMTVTGLGDGNALGTFVVSAGAVTLPRNCARVTIGLPYTSDLETLDLDPPQVVFRDKQKLLKNATIVLEASRNVMMGPDTAHLIPAKQDTPTDYDVPPTLLTGNQELAIQASWRTSGRIVVRQSEPLPCTVLAVIPNFEAGG